MRFVRPPYWVRSYYSDLVWRVSTSEKKIYLTFDDGPVPEVTPWVLDVLKEFDAKATFFCVGGNVEKHPEVFKRILQEGHGVGNHTFNHLNGWKTGDKAYLENVLKCDEVMARTMRLNSSSSSSPQKEKRLLRPPYGRIRKSQIAALRGNFSIVMWDVLSYDFDASVSPEKCLKNVMRNVREGSIVVFHDSLKARKNLEFVLPKVLEQLRDKGFGFEIL
jgi:peptidoglycan/xylan/chitin deacetylase (PgdA/CDA1 family)